MKQILHIAFREINSFFNSLSAYLLIVIFWAFSGFFTWIYGADIFFVGQASLETFFFVAYWTLFLLIPALTMRSIAGETKNGTLELMLTKPVTDWEFVLGKFTSIFILIAITLMPTVIYYITLYNIGSIDTSAVILGYVGLLLMSSVYISIGILSSCLTSNAITASILTLAIGICFHAIFGMLAANTFGFAGSFFNYLSMAAHFKSISQGIIDTKDLIYFLSIAALSLFITKSLLSLRRIES